MPDLGARDLLREWQKAVDAVVSSASSAAGRAPIPSQLTEVLQRQVELIEEVLERERRLQRDVARRLVAPVDVVFDLLENSASAMRGQAEAIEAAGLALAETAALMRQQAELFERTLGGLREPAELAKAAAGLERKPRAARAARGAGRSPGGRSRGGAGGDGPARGAGGGR